VQVSDYLLNQGGYTAALHTMNADQLPASPFQTSSRAYLGTLTTDWNVLDGPVGVQYMGATNWSIPVGIFSSADLPLASIRHDLGRVRRLSCRNACYGLHPKGAGLWGD